MKRIITAGAAVLASAVNIGAAAISALDDERPMFKPKKKRGHGVKLADARRKAEAKAQAARIEGAAGPAYTRQQRRQDERRADKMPLGARQDLWHEAKGLPKIKPRRRGVAHA